MNASDMSWLLQTIEDPKIEKRFVEAQYRRARISYDLMVGITEKLDSINCIGDQASISIVRCATAHSLLVDSQ